MKTLTLLVAGATVGMLSVVSAEAGSLRRGDGPTLVWVQIDAAPDEGRWQACRRVYQHDVHQVRRGRGNTMWCNIESHRLFDNDRRRRNFNLN